NDAGIGRFCMAEQLRETPIFYRTEASWIAHNNNPVRVVQCQDNAYLFGKVIVPALVLMELFNRGLPLTGTNVEDRVVGLGPSQAEGIHAASTKCASELMWLENAPLKTFGGRY